MKVYQLMNLLEAAPAGADVKLTLHGTGFAVVECAHVQDKIFLISGADVEVIDDNAQSMGMLSELVSVDDE